ncbi:efflux RND transporter periplasmic adaptor subunit [Chitinophaga rhizophila]|uniref:Efflux RND transporter periplasmic adaptor subunit n=1 Tax=Chitinophaga rhizophila TaxID=2866212 RepID=A0ABS7G835_9BACT|nr:efflux RND transporter periplasmic adaptor subunit [Chitinophaga rhizophila]MBW8682723.1 efflux RND transporter periplasmic adaptor subunit [Chitinophaga rhizophila]
MKQLIYIPLLVILAGCGNKTEKAAEHEDEHAATEGVIAELTPAQYATAGIKTGKIEQQQISSNIRANGKLDVPPQSMITISSPFGAFVKNTELLQGSLVRKGQKVVSLQHPDLIQLQQEYLENKGQEEYLLAEYKRQEELAKENVNAQKVYQQAKANYLSNAARTKGLREKLRLLNINLPSLDAGNIQSEIQLFSPINGYVTAVNTNIGVFVNPSDKLFEIVNTEHLHAEVTVFEKDIPRLKLEQRVRFTLANETTQRTARVHLIGRQISNERTVQVHCHLDNEDKELLPGMYLTAWIETGNAMVNAVPDEAVIQFEGKPCIFIAKGREGGAEGNYVYEMLYIEKGNSELGYTEVILPPGFDIKGADIVVKGAYALFSVIKNTGDEDHHH